MNSTIEDIYRSLVYEVNSASNWDDWDSGYIAGLNRAIALMYEVYGFELDTRQD